MIVTRGSGADVSCEMSFLYSGVENGSLILSCFTDDSRTNETLDSTAFNFYHFTFYVKLMNNEMNEIRDMEIS